jgi:hypothetical protein
LRRIPPTSGRRNCRACTRVRSASERASAWALSAAPASVTSSIAQPQSRTACGQPHQDAGLQRQALAGAAQQRSSSGTTWMRATTTASQQHRGDDGGIDRDAARVAGELFFLRERGADVADRLGQAAGLLARAQQADRDRGEGLGLARGGARQRQPALDVGDQRADHLLQPRLGAGVAQQGQALEGRHAGGEELLEVEAEGDQLAARMRLARQLAVHAAGTGVDQQQRARIEQAFEFAEVGRIELATHAAAVGSERAVAPAAHGAFLPSLHDILRGGRARCPSGGRRGTLMPLLRARSSP